MAIRHEDTALLRLEGTAKADAVPRAEAARQAVPARPGLNLRRVRTGMMSAVWLLAGGVVLSYGGTLLYANVVSIEADAAVVSGTVQPVRAPAAGLVTAPLMAPGEAFGQGARLFTIRNPELEQSIALAGVRVERARQDLRQREAEREAELARRDNLIIRATAEIERLDEEVQALTAIDRSVRHRLSMMSQLFASGYTSRLRLEEATQRAADSRADLARARIRQAERQGMLDALVSGHGLGAGEAVVRLADANAAVERARAEISLTSQELQVRLRRREDMTVNAAAPGRMLRVIRLDGSQVLAGDAVALVERDDERLVYAFLTQEDAGRVALGDQAEVMLPAQRLSTRARVVAVERAGGYLDDVETRYSWSQSHDTGQRLSDRDRTARVTLRFDEADLAAARRVVDLGTPAIVTFDRRWNGAPLFASFQRLAEAVRPAVTARASLP